MDFAAKAAAAAQRAGHLHSALCRRYVRPQYPSAELLILSRLETLAYSVNGPQAWVLTIRRRRWGFRVLGAAKRRRFPLTLCLRESISIVVRKIHPGKPGACVGAEEATCWTMVGYTWPIDRAHEPSGIGIFVCIALGELLREELVLFGTMTSIGFSSLLLYPPPPSAQSSKRTTIQRNVPQCAATVTRIQISHQLQKASSSRSSTSFDAFWR